MSTKIFCDKCKEELSPQDFERRRIGHLFADREIRIEIKITGGDACSKCTKKILDKRWNLK